MPIPNELISRSLIQRVLTPATTVAELLYLFAEHPEPHKVFAVVCGGPDAYDVLALNDLCYEPVSSFVNDRRDLLGTLPLAAVPELLRLGAPIVQSQAGEDRATREQAQRHRRRLVVLDDAGQIVGVMASVNLGVPKGGSPLELIGVGEPGVLGPDDEPPAAPPAPPHLNVRLDGVAPGSPLTVGQLVPLRVAVGAPSMSGVAASKPFAFDFAGAPEPVHFTVHVDADEELWQVQIVQPTLIVAPPGNTTQEALFLITAKVPLQEKLLISVERADTGATVQKLWLPLRAAPAQTTTTFAVAAINPVEVVQPLDAPGLARPAVEVTVQPGIEGSQIVVRADLPGGTVRKTYKLPVSGAAIQNAAIRLRQELQKIVFYREVLGEPSIFASRDTVTVDDPALARRAYLALADAGEQVWRMLFSPPGGDEGLKTLAEEVRTLSHGSHFRVVLDSQQFIVPWALLYDKPGPITTETLAWDGFWGYRYCIDVLPPGRYPAPAIADAPLGLLLLFNDDENLRGFTTAQEQFVQATFPSSDRAVAWGHSQVQQLLMSPPLAAFVYCYCHGDHASGAFTNTKRNVSELASESALFFSGNNGLRLADLRRLPAAPLSSRPLVFLNACEGATQDAFYYDGFMPFFIEQQLARGFIGTEVKAPQLLAHELAIQFLTLFAQGRPVGEILYQLRRHYLDQHNNILAFNYSLYCQGETRLVTSDE